MFDEYIRGRICSLGINVVGCNKDGELHITKISKKKREFLSSNSSIASDDSVSSSNYTENGTIDCSSIECNSQTIVKKDNEPGNTSKTNIDSNSKFMKGVYKTKKIFLPTHFQSTTSFVTNFLPHQEEPDNTSSALTEKDNVPKAKREKEVCQLQKTYGYSDKQKVVRRRRKISI